MRFCAWDEDKTLAEYNQPHESVWYPVAYEIPELMVLSMAVTPKGSTLGGVLITKIPPGGEVKPHADRGWHAEHYFDKRAIQLQGHKRQGFHFDNVSLYPETGEVYAFDNSQVHWVTNESEIDRMTMIVCTRPSCPGV